MTEQQQKIIDSLRDGGCIMPGARARYSVHTKSGTKFGTNRATIESLIAAKSIRLAVDRYVYAAPGEIDAAFELEVQDAHRRLLAGELITNTRFRHWNFGNGDPVGMEVVKELRKRNLIDHADRVTTPEAEAEKRREQDDRREAAKRDRLDKWTDMIAKTRGIAIRQGELDEVLIAIYRESSSIGGLDDE